MINNVKKVITNASVISLIVLAFNGNSAEAAEGSSGQTGAFTQSLIPRTGAPVPLVAAPRDDDQAEEKDKAPVAAKDPDQDYVLQKAARN